MDGQSLIEFAHYIARIITDGNFNNPWLAQLPAKIQPALYEVGKALAAWLGF